jgi:hypothetical protein
MGRMEQETVSFRTRRFCRHKDMADKLEYEGRRGSTGTASEVDSGVRVGEGRRYRVGGKTQLKYSASHFASLPFD